MIVLIVGRTLEMLTLSPCKIKVATFKSNKISFNSFNFSKSVIVKLNFFLLVFLYHIHVLNFLIFIFFNPCKSTCFTSIPVYRCHNFTPLYHTLLKGSSGGARLSQNEQCES
jgi:hypothetical protein